VICYGIFGLTSSTARRARGRRSFFSLNAEIADIATQQQ
jgi:hypothetical protein